MIGKRLAELHATFAMPTDDPDLHGAGRKDDLIAWETRTQDQLDKAFEALERARRRSIRTRPAPPRRSRRTAERPTISFGGWHMADKRD